MSYGFNVIDAAGRLMVDEKAGALHYIGQATYVGTDGNASFLNFDINSPGGAPLPFIEVTPGAGQQVSITNVYNVSGSTWRVTAIAMVDSKIHCFAPLAVGSVAVGAWGLQVFDAAGNVKYDTTRKPLAITQSASFPAGSGTVSAGAATDAGAQSLSITLGGSRPAISNSSAFRVLTTNSSTGSPPGQTFVGVVRVDASALVRKSGPLVATSGPSAGPYYWSAIAETILVVDIAPYI